MYMFKGDGTPNNDVFAPERDKETLFEPENDDTKYSWMLYLGVAGAFLIVLGILGIVYDVVALLVVPVLVTIIGFLCLIVAIWVWFDSGRI